MDLKDYFGLTKVQYNYLTKISKLSNKDFFDNIPIFQVENRPATMISVMHAVDHCGDFSENPRNPTAKIAKEVFKNLSNEDKMKVIEYINEECYG